MADSQFSENCLKVNTKQQINVLLWTRANNLFTLETKFYKFDEEVNVFDRKYVILSIDVDV